MGVCEGSGLGVRSQCLSHTGSAPAHGACSLPAHTARVSTFFVLSKFHIWVLHRGKMKVKGLFKLNSYKPQTCPPLLVGAKFRVGLDTRASVHSSWQRLASGGWARVPLCQQPPVTPSLGTRWRTPGQWERDASQSRAICLSPRSFRRSLGHKEWVPGL